PQVLDSGLSDRSRRHPPALGGPRKNHRILSGIFHCYRRRTGFEDCVRLLRYVGTLPKSHSREMLRGASHPRSFSHRGENEQGTGRNPSGESRRIASEGGVAVLKKSRWLLLKREESLKTEQRFRLRDLLRDNLKTVRAYFLKEAFQQLWDYNSPAWAGKFLDDWCRQVMRSRIEPMKNIAQSLRQHRELILNYFRAQKLLSSGVV